MTEEKTMRPSMRRWPSRCGSFLAIASLILGPCQQVFAQDVMKGSGPGRGGSNCRPVSDRDNEHTQEAGCWIMARMPQGEILQPTVFWHIHSYSSRSEAEAAKGLLAAVIEGLGRIWLRSVNEVGSPPVACASQKLVHCKLSPARNTPPNIWWQSSLLV